MNSSEPSTLPQTARHEIVVDDELAERPENGPAWITPVALFAGLLLTLLLSRSGVHFFFLPIILPFGLGGRHLLRQFLPPPRRILRLDDGLLWLAAEGAFRTSVVDRLRVSSGAFVALGSTGLWLNGLEDARVRIVSDDGALTIPVRGGERARTLRSEIEDLFDLAGIASLDHDIALQGDVWAEPFDSGEQIEWSSGGPSSGFFAARSATALRVTPDAWALRVRSGGRAVVSTGGPGPLEARLAPVTMEAPLAASVAHDAIVLELTASGERVAEVGMDLSEPELRWIARRIERATRVEH